MMNDQVIQRRRTNFDKSSEAIVKIIIVKVITGDLKVVFIVQFSTSF